MMERDTLQRRFQSQFGPLDAGTKERPLLVALSGGLDSLVLLHLLRFGTECQEGGVHAVHFDHRMRVESGADADWVKGLCRAWQIPFHCGRAESVPGSEDAAREMRYEYLLEVKDRLGASWLLTAHHEDDQAETVLFRAFRGTGLRGLAGIPPRRPPGIFRPLLPFSREMLEAYASRHRIRPRQDASNEKLTIPRNFLRHRLLPLAEEKVAPGARRALVRLARLARENEEAWESLLPGILAELVEETERGMVVVRSALLAYHPAVQGRVMRALLRTVGMTLDEAGTRRLLEFTRTGSSGRVHELPGGLRLSREFDSFLLDSRGENAEEQPLLIPGPEPGSGEASVGGKRMTVSWGGALNVEGFRGVFLAASELRFPLRIRGWIPGDRVALPQGGKKLKKLFREAGIPAGIRKQVPVLVDAGGRVLWVGGVAVSALVRAGSQEIPFFIGIRDGHES